MLLVTCLAVCSSSCYQLSLVLLLMFSDAQPLLLVIPTTESVMHAPPPHLPQLLSEGCAREAAEAGRNTEQMSALRAQLDGLTFIAEAEVNSPPLMNLPPDLAALVVTGGDPAAAGGAGVQQPSAAQVAEVATFPFFGRLRRDGERGAADSGGLVG